MKRRRLVSVVKLTFSAPYDHILITCCPSFQVFLGSVFYFYSLHVSIWWCKFKFKLEILDEFFLCESAWECWGFFKKSHILREIPKTRFMDFGLLYENEKGEYVVLNDVRMADIRLASLVYLFVHVSVRSSLPSFLKNWLNFRVRGQFEIKILIIQGHSDINRTYFIWIIGKNKLEPAINWTGNFSADNFKNTRPRWVDA